VTARDKEVQSRIPPAGQHFRGTAALAPPPALLTDTENQVSSLSLPTLAMSAKAALKAQQQRLGQSPGDPGVKATGRKPRPEEAGEDKEESTTEESEADEADKGKGSSKAADRATEEAEGGAGAAEEAARGN
jgi:hypothetical protein